MLDQARIRRGHRVLPIGVGIGEEAIAAAPRVGSVGEVVATDASAAMIAEARRAVDPAGLRSVRCLHMDAQRLDFEPESFDAIIARNALMFIRDLPGALEEMKRVLRAGGRISATVWATGQRNPRLYDPLRVARALGAVPPAEATYHVALRLGQPRLLSKALQRAGYSEIAFDRIAVVAGYATVDAAVEQAMEHGGTQELLVLLPQGSESRMRTLLAERWERFHDASGVRLPGEQLVFGPRVRPKVDRGQKLLGDREIRRQQRGEVPTVDREAVEWIAVAFILLDHEPMGARVSAGAEDCRPVEGAFTNLGLLRRAFDLRHVFEVHERMPAYHPANPLRRAGTRVLQQVGVQLRFHVLRPHVLASC